MLFENLNIDCMLHIISYCDLRSQFALRKVSVHLDDYVYTHWRRQRKIVLSEVALEMASRGDIRKLLTTTCTELRDFTMVFFREDHLSLVMEFTFPALKRLEITFDLDGDHNLLVRPLAGVCPALTSLILYGNNSGVHIWYFENLTELTLDGCACLSSRHFIRIFTTLKLRKFSMLFYGYELDLLPAHLMTIAYCVTLEELYIDDQYLTAGVINQVLGLPLLRKLVCYTCDFHEYLIQSVSRLRGRDVLSVMYHDMYWASNLHFQCLTQMGQLRRFALTADDIASNQLLCMKNHWPQLRELHFTNYRGALTQQFFEMVNLSQIDLLNLTETRVSKTHLEVLGWAASLKTILDRRAKPLKIHLAVTDPEEQTNIRREIAHRMLEISFEPLKVHELSARFMQIDLQPLPQTV